MWPVSGIMSNPGSGSRMCGRKGCDSKGTVRPNGGGAHSQGNGGITQFILRRIFVLNMGAGTQGRHTRLSLMPPVFDQNQNTSSLRWGPPLLG